MWAGMPMTKAQAEPPAQAPTANSPSLKEPPQGRERRAGAYEIDIQAPKPLADLLQSYLDLARFRAATQAQGITRGELRRLVRDTPTQARELLETEGYFNAQITVELGTEEPPRVRVQVEPGPRAQISSVEIDVQGDSPSSDPLKQESSLKALRDIRQRWSLPQGSFFTQAAWAQAKNNALTHIRTQGFPAAEWAQTNAVVHAQENRVELALGIKTGPLFLLGPVRVEGLSRYGEQSVTALSPFTTGTPYSEKLILDFQERLRKVGLFESVAVDIDHAVETADAAPVIVKVREQPLQQATVGVGISDNVGPRVSLEHLHRSALGTRWMAKNKFELGKAQQLWQGELISHPLANGSRNLVAGNVERQTAAGTVVQSTRLRVGRAIDTEALEQLVFLEAISASTRTELLGEFQSVTTNTSNQAFSGNVHWLRRNLDNVLLPTDGESFNAQLGAGYALGGGPANNGPFTRLYGRMMAFRPLGRSWFGSLRLEAGQVLAGAQVGIPDTLMFRAGGDDSVRGYGYRTLGPTEAGVVRSARVLLTGSAEVARPISDRMPSLWGAAFVDAGNAADQWGRLDPQLGYGVGLRWRSPIGAVRIDLAYGQAVELFRLHFSLGVSF
jgi:translocation and assembly module TamA